MHFLELLEQVSDRDTAVYYAKNCGSIPKKNYAASRTLIDGNYSFGWCGTVQGHKFWAEIHTKLGNHTQDEEVTYEPEVYKMYKTQNFVEEVSSNIRDYSVIIKDTSIADRRKLHSLLNCLNEPVFKTTGLSTDRSVGFSYFTFDIFGGVWVMAHTIGDSKQAITIQDFIAKFSKPNTTAPEEDIKVGAQYTNTTGVVCTIFEVNEGSEFANVIKYKTAKNSGGVTNRNNIRKNWKLLVTPTIKVGEVYTNSAGSECIITEVNTNGSIIYLHKDGNYYTIGANAITANWIKEPVYIQNYAIDITDTSLESRLKVKDILLHLKEPVFLKSRAFVSDEILDKSYLSMLSYEWLIGDKSDIETKTIVTIEEFIELFGTKQEQEKTTKMKHICEVLEELFDKETAIKFANNAIKKPHLHSKVLTEKNAINSLLWESTPEGDVFWRVIHKQLSSTDKVSMCMDTFKEYASKDVPHALETKQTKTTKKETFMSKLKTTTLNTLEQNKQAAIIAAKVDAGRIINKQVIKQLKPHVPMLLRGYLDTPLAPVIAANVVAMIGNHTDNSKVKKVSELMLLGAADATVQSFNLDKIIDDVLAGIKLPAGFLDADDN